MSEERIICVGCPLGCSIQLILNNKKEITKISGNKCKEGKAYALEEFTNPVRTLTATVLTRSSSQPLLPVRTNKPILKVHLKQSMDVIARTRVTPPVKIGEVIVPNLLGYGVDVVACSDLYS